MSKDRLVIDEAREPHHIASRAAHETVKPSSYENGGYVWETRADATKALRAANAALKVAQSNVPLPEWAKSALAAGWKMPKGWQP